ncbi:lytic polysaccharide monooxygenase [Yersinia pekkanenii]|uniref:Fibronectin type III domain-containing protein n=1 Tax=Yersinia pekkanenii TaxID=1288385 RepID=A0A0T9Q9E7_9GAMM|nr:lytic polysaccharide monooxygenase [Yersinia pekkanenii]CNI01899.1 fibronectin type III domain-containing protein [Yersinia pekkanenii]CRY63652.1 fibronectin type III domain-containing protein [Yersinia pekkanenii]
MKKRSATIISRSKNTDASLFHSHIFSPASRAYFAWQAGLLNLGQLNQRESGKFFPATAANLQDVYAPSDVVSALPPPDGKIASGNQDNGEFLDKPGTHWDKHDVLSGEVIPVIWGFGTPHLTRRWNYFMTRTDWNPNLPLSRAQFEHTPFYQVQLHEQPTWVTGVKDALTPSDPTHHDVILPTRSGYHVLLAVWEVADTGNAFYQVIDLNFVGDGSNDQPLPPTGLRTTSTTNNSVSLAWTATVSDVSHYKIYRDGSLLTTTTALSVTDSALQADTAYTYAVSTVNATGVESALSIPVSARTLSNNSNDLPPSAPTDLHSMGKTESSVSLMWGLSASSAGIKVYLIYRDGVQIAEVPYTKSSFEDTGLQAETTYRYFVAAQDTLGRLSVPSNVYSVTTAASTGGGGGDGGGSTYPAWQLGAIYAIGDKVSSLGRNWLCFSAHTAHSEDWQPGGKDYNTLWSLLP